jgi:hypothetical protein
LREGVLVLPRPLVPFVSQASRELASKLRARYDFVRATSHACDKCFESLPAHSPKNVWA